MLRWRGLMAEEVGDPAAYEEAHLAAFRRMVNAHDWQREGTSIGEVSVEGTFPETKVVTLFRPAANRMLGTTDRPCLFGARWPNWPAQYEDPEQEAFYLLIDFQDFLAVGPQAKRWRHGPCEPDGITWLD